MNDEPITMTPSGLFPSCQFRHLQEYRVRTNPVSVIDVEDITEWVVIAECPEVIETHIFKYLLRNRAKDYEAVPWENPQHFI